MSQVKKITLFKIKPDLEFSDFLLGDLSGYDHEVRDDEGFEIYIKYHDPLGSEKTEAKIPWIGFLNSGFSEKKYVYKHTNKYPRAVMAVKFSVDDKNRFYVATFGQHGDSYINKESIVRDFGIRVGMNICDLDRLRRIQTMVHEAITRQTERQASTGAKLRVFGVNTESEFFKTISGYVRPEYSGIVDSFLGSDSIAIKLPRDKSISWKGLVDICNSLDERYNSKDYLKTEFRVYDILRHEKDKSIIKELESALCAKISAKDFDKIHLSPPEFSDLGFSDISYQPVKGSDTPHIFDDLRIDDLVNVPKRRLKNLTVSTLKNWKIYIYDSEANESHPKWNAYECLVAEVDHKGKAYVLANSQWREISPELKDKVNKYFKDGDFSLDAPYLPNGVSIFDAKKSQNREDVYNRHVASSNSEIFLFDKSKIKIANSNYYEICDLFHSDKHFIHVKRYTSGASSISHIFTQVKLYSHAFSTDDETRESFSKWIEENQESENLLKDRDKFRSLVPKKCRDMNESEFSIIFCLLVGKDNFSVEDLPFMSQYELMLTHKFLTEDRRYNVGIVFRKVKGA